MSLSDLATLPAFLTIFLLLYALATWGLTRSWGYATIILVPAAASLLLFLLLKAAETK